MVDIIIPVYNTPSNDLKRCLDSILKQTSNDYKVYIIDDGSNEETKKFLNDYIKDKNNFILKSITNSGVSNARNIGIDISTSPYIAFVDSDDSLEPKFIEESLQIIKDNNLDIIIGGYNEIRNNTIDRIRLCDSGIHIYEKEKINNFLEKLLSSKTNERNKEIKDAPVGRIYTRLFKRRSIKSLRFDTNIHMSEDTLFMIDYTLQTSRIGLIDKVWYNYYINDYSISKSTNKDKMINNITEFIKEIEKRRDKEQNPVLIDAYNARIEKANNQINKLR